MLKAKAKDVLISILENTFFVGAVFLKSSAELLPGAISLWDSHVDVAPENFYRDHWDFIQFNLDKRVMFNLKGDEVVMELESSDDLRVVDPDEATKFIGSAVELEAGMRGRHVRFHIGKGRKNHKVVLSALKRFVKLLFPPPPQNSRCSVQ
uniref:Uncharacterized protein n=1 Tax=Lankesteria abbotti TaxID=340204 RepID=A0A7S2VTY3_9APIC|mmetsp:Transcript_2084/g.2523  ORF Transcript_2084/g.2523 Transcript_2084/m.2523 type:complete len:151 (+) Transcript_2084:236-688(+)